MHPVDDGTTVSPLNLSDCDLFGLGCVPAMTTALAVATPDDIKFAVNYFLGQNHFAFPEVAFRALRENVKAGDHTNGKKPKRLIVVPLSSILAAPHLRNRGEVGDRLGE